MATGEVEAMYFLLNIPLIYLIFIVYFHKKNSIFLYNFCQKWLDTLHYVITFFMDLRQVGGFLRVPGLRFPPPRKLTATI